MAWSEGLPGEGWQPLCPESCRATQPLINVDNCVCWSAMADVVVRVQFRLTGDLPERLAAAVDQARAAERA